MDYPKDFINKIICGDCLKIMKKMPDKCVDLILTDPPFSFAGGISNGFSSRADSQFFEHWLTSVFKEFYRISNPLAWWILWSDWRTMSVYNSALSKSAIDYYNQRWVSQVVIHNRDMVGMGRPFRNQTDWVAVIRGKKSSSKLNIPKNQPNIIKSYWYYGKHPNHPSEKSLSIAKKFISWFSNENNLIFDPFLGSGTTAEACKLSHRNFIGIEINPEYCKIAEERLAQRVL